MIDFTIKPMSIKRGYSENMVNCSLTTNSLTPDNIEFLESQGLKLKKIKKQKTEQC